MTEARRQQTRSMRADCLEIVGLVETVFEPAALALFQQQGAARRLGDVVQRVAHTVGPEGQAQLEHAVTRAASHLQVVDGQFGFLETVAEKLSTTARQIQRLSADQKRNMVLADMVATNARVVSASIRDEKQTLTGFAEDVKQIISTAQAEATRVAQTLEHAESGLQRVSSGILSMTETAKSLARSSASLPAIIEVMHDFPDAMQMVARTQSLCRRLDSALQKAVVLFQCGDAVRQRLEHVVAILDLRDTLGHGMPLLDALAVGQMNAALDDLLAATTGSLPLIAEIDSTAKAVMEEIRALSLRRETQILKDVSTLAEAMMAGLQTLDHVRTELEPSMNWLADAYGAAAVAAGEIAELQPRMHLLGINGMLASNKLGSDGQAMIQVAVYLRDCTAEIGRHSAEIVHSAQMQELNAILFAAPTAQATDAENEASLRAVKADCDALHGTLQQLAVRQDGEGFRDLSRVLGDLQTLSERLVLVRPLAVARPSTQVDDALGESLDQVRRLYTMQSERDLHDMITGRRVPSAETVPEPEAASDTEEDDIFF